MGGYHLAGWQRDVGQKALVASQELAGNQGRIRKKKGCKAIGRSGRGALDYVGLD